MVAKPDSKDVGADAMSISTNLARSTVRQLIELGIQDVVLSPGSRNAPLSLAFYHAEKKGLIRLHIRIDERSAAFFALGITKATGKYVPVVCTSGTAVANYYPAVLEAHHSDLNLLLLTADRPAHLRKTGSNQTTLQSHIFGEFVRHSVDSAAPIEVSHLLSGSGPVHINLQFDEPLLPEDSREWLDGVHINPPSRGTKTGRDLKLTSARNVLIVGHDRAGFSIQEIEDFALKVAAPIIAEDPLSFSHSVAHAPVIFSDERSRQALIPDSLFVIGRTTLSRTVNHYIKESPKVIVIDPRAENIDSARSADLVLHQLPKISSVVTRDDQWFATWEKYESLATQAVSSLTEWNEPSALAQIAKEIEGDTALFISSSRPIRDIESFAQPRSGVTTYANRGLAGIDGNISTVFGIATEFESNYAILGDLTFLHDISALTNKTDKNVRIYVINNNGGGIFSTLSQAGVENFESLFGTPHNLDLVKVCEGFQVKAKSVSNLDQLQALNNQPVKGLEVVIVEVPNREINAKILRDLTQRVSSAVRIGINLA